MEQEQKPNLLIQIHDLINKDFDQDEFRELCHYLEVDYDNLRGETKSARIHDLVQQQNRQGKLDNLLHWCRYLRPNTEWPELSAPVSLAAVPAPVTAPKRNPRQIFLSHAYQDAEFAHQLANDLRDSDWQIWIAPDSIQPGEKWVDAIDRGLAESSICLLVLTPDAVKSRWVNSETNAAISLQHQDVLHFIPLKVKPTDGVPALWQTYQWIPFQSDYKSGLERLLIALQLESTGTDLNKHQSQRNLLNKWLGQLPIWSWVIAGLILSSLLIGSFWASSFNKRKGGEGNVTAVPSATTALIVAQVETDTPAPSPTQTVKTEPTGTRQPMDTPTNEPSRTPTLMATSTPGIGSTRIRPADEAVMVYVPAGEFVMGSEDGNDDEKPLHVVYLDSYWIDKTEVSNGMYTLCVRDGDCSRPSNLNSFTRSSYYPNPAFSNYPVIYVSWEDANSYCKWAGGRLPSEAEWEKAARWDEEAQEVRTYPWGERIDCDLANFNQCNGDTVAVGSYPDGVSPYGALDMTGNVWEWVNDKYSADYYDQLIYENPKGPEQGLTVVLRGGSWINGLNNVRTASRFYNSPTIYVEIVGFRCAQD